VLVLGAVALRNDDGRSVSVPPATSAPATLPTAQEVRSALLPVSYSDFLAQESFINFQSNIEFAAAADCMGSPYRQAPQNQLEGSRANLFEDPATLRQYWFGITRAMQTTRPTIPELNETQDCINQARAASQPFTELFDTVNGPWMQSLNDLETSPEISHAWTAWSDCMSTHGYNVKTQAEFFSLVDGSIRDAGSLPATEQSEQKLAEDYASCLPPVIAARETTRGAHRNALEATPSAALKRAESELPTVITTLAARYRVAPPSTLPTADTGQAQGALSTTTTESGLTGTP
jgi:hypothetical protein